MGDEQRPVESGDRKHGRPEHGVATEVSARDIRGSAALVVGATADGLGDRYATPRSGEVVVDIALLRALTSADPDR